jgi:hypothetical protein
MDVKGNRRSIDRRADAVPVGTRPLVYANGARSADRDFHRGLSGFNSS